MDWHTDHNSAAQKFYPSKGRRGKGMTGKASQMALLRGKHSKFANKWLKLYEQRYRKDCEKRSHKPSEDEVKTACDDALRIAIDKGTVYNDIERWTDNGVVLSLRHPQNCHCNVCKKFPLDDLGAAAASMAAYVEASKKAAADKAAGKLADEKAEREARDYIIKMIGIRTNPKVPEPVMGRLINGLIERQSVISCFNVSNDVLADHLEAFKHLNGATD